MNEREIQNKISKIQETIQKLNNKLEQLKGDCLKEINRTGYERVCDGDGYYWIGATGEICNDIDRDVPFDNQIWNNSNYYNDENLAEMQAIADTLWRKIRRWQALNDEPVDMYSANSKKYYIYYHITKRALEVGFCSCAKTSDICFSSKEQAKECIKEFKDDLMWYFTKYKSRMDM